MTNRHLVGISVVAVLVLLLPGATIPKWLLVIAVTTAVLLGLKAGVAQKRMERRLARSLWRAAMRRRHE